MTSKELNQIAEILSGSGRYKLLDCSRKDVYDLPAGAFKLWHVIYRMETNQEAYPNLDTLTREARMDKKTVIKWRKYLLETGWLVKTGGNAAEHYSKPSQGAHLCPTVRVDDPTKRGGISPLGEGGWNNSTPISPLNACSCCCSCPCSCVEVGIEVGTKLKLKVKPECDDVSSFPTETTSLRSAEKQKPNQRQKQKQQQQQQQQPERVSSAAKWLAKYDAPKPVEFNSWNQETRSKWTVDHDRKNLKVSVPVEVKPEPKPMVLPVESKPEVPALPPVVESATPMSPQSGYESHKPVTATVTAPAKAPVRSAMPTPPSSAPPPKPAEPIDYRPVWMKMLAKEIYTFQTCLHGNVKPPTDWETAWLADTDALVKLAEGKGSMPGSMLTGVIALSQVRYATKYITPRAILADVMPLGREVVELITQGTFAEVRDAYYEVVCPPEQQSDEDELDDKPTMWIDPEVKAARERKELAQLITRWNTWLDAHTPQEKMA